MGSVPKTPTKQERRPRILVAEDDPALRKMISVILRSFADVETVADGMEAYTYLRHNDPPDLLISDVMMPRMDGLTLTNRMKNDDTLKLIPVILLTAKGGPRDMITGINAGARHYVTKPFDRETFLGKVKKTLGIR